MINLALFEKLKSAVPSTSAAEPWWQPQRQRRMDAARAAAAAMAQRIASPLRRLQEDEILRAEDQEEEGGMGLAVIIGIAVAVVVLVGWRLVRYFRYWANRARSAKVLDEIEMEFVNDDIDHDLVEDDDYPPSGHSRTTSTWDQR